LTIAVATAAAAFPPIAWRMRKAVRLQISGEAAQPMLAAM